MTTLEKIRDEIEKVFCMSVVTNELRTPMEVKTEILQIIDKYAEQEPKNSEDNKIIRRTLENFMRGLWEEIQVGELEYTTSEVYEMIEREIFTDNHVAISSAQPKTGHCKECKWWKDSDGLYRRGAHAESQCPINRREVLEGNGYCYMFEPRKVR